MCFHGPAGADARTKGPGTAVSPSKRIGGWGWEGSEGSWRNGSGGRVVAASAIREQGKMGMQKMKREHAVVTEGKARFVFASDSVKKVEMGTDCWQKRNSGYLE